jgi:hypothetical protein
MPTYEEILATHPATDHQLPTPRVLEATDDVINLDVPFTLEMPPVSAESYSDVLLIFANADGSPSPSAAVAGPAVNGVPVRGVVENDKLNPPFDRDQTAVLKGFLRLRQPDVWVRTPDSPHYTF